MPYPAKLDQQQILDAAQTLLESGGVQALTMRNLAQALGVRASSLYRHVDNQGVLLRALGDRAALTLRELLLGAADGLPPRAALLAATQVYLTYARTHPHLYALLLTKEAPTTPAELRYSAGKQLWNTILQLVGRLSGNPDDTDHAVAYWTFLHGYASLDAAGTYGPTGPKGGLEIGIEALLNHMEQPRPKSDDEDCESGTVL